MYVATTQQLADKQREKEKFIARDSINRKLFWWEKKYSNLANKSDIEAQAATLTK